MLQLMTNTHKGMESAEQIAKILRGQGLKVQVMAHTNGPGRKSPFDLLVGKYRVEVKVCPRQNSGLWIFNIHRHGIINEDDVDFYILRLENVPNYDSAVDLVMRAPVRRFTIHVSLRSLVTRYIRYAGRYDFLGGVEENHNQEDTIDYNACPKCGHIDIDAVIHGVCKCGAERLTPREIEFLRAWEEYKPKNQTAAAIAMKLSRQRVFQLVERLIEKGYMAKRNRVVTVTYFEDGRSNGKKR